MGRQMKLCPHVLDKTCDGFYSEGNLCVCARLHLEGTDCSGNKCAYFDSAKCLNSGNLLAIQERIGRYR